YSGHGHLCAKPHLSLSNNADFLLRDSQKSFDTVNPLIQQLFTMDNDQRRLFFVRDNLKPHDGLTGSGRRDDDTDVFLTHRFDNIPLVLSQTRLEHEFYLSQLHPVIDKIMCYLHLPAKPDQLSDETSRHDDFMLRFVDQLKETWCFKCTFTTFLFDDECGIREVK